MSSDYLFTPSFGNRPQELVGRSEVMTELATGLNTAPGSRERSVLILGQRGLGKTVVLLELAEQARKEKFVVPTPTIASSNMLDRIIEKLQVEGESLIKKDKPKVSGGSIGFLGFSAGLQFSIEEDERRSFAYKLSKIVSAIDDKGYGTLLLIDEVQASNAALRELIIAYQELVGEGRNVAIVLAGIPGAVSSLLNDKVLTFLNRAKKVYLDSLNLVDVDAYYERSFPKAGINISLQQRRDLAKATQGSPYLMQLIGHHLSVYARGKDVLSDDVVSQAAAIAKDDYLNDICRATLEPLTEKDLLFLNAMADDEGASRMSDIAGRMSVGADYAQQYKRRLIDAGIIKQERRGEVEYAVPYLQEYLRRQHD